MKITCAIIDDEPLARALLESYVEKTPFLELKGQYSCASQAMHDLTANPVNLVFLDIQMPDLDGMTFSHLLPNKTRIIFTTAFSEYAVESFRVNALDYLKKPIDFKEFLESANKALNWFESQEKTEELSKQKRQMNNEEEDFFYVKSEYKLVQVKVSKLLYIEGLKDYLKLHIEGEPRPIMTLLSMKAMEESLPSPRFLRIHRSYIVQMSKVTNVNKAGVTIGDTHLPVSDGYKDELQRYVVDHLI